MREPRRVDPANWLTAEELPRWGQLAGQSALDANTCLRLRRSLRSRRAIARLEELLLGDARQLRLVRLIGNGILRHRLAGQATFPVEPPMAEAQVARLVERPTEASRMEQR